MQIEIHKGKHLKDGTTSIDFTQDGKPLKLEKDKRTPHPDLINAFQALDIHAALIPPRLLQPDEVKRKKFKVPDTTNTHWRPEFESKETSEDFHCTGFTLTDKGAVILSGTVKSESNGSMNYNCPQKSLEQTELFGTYDYTEDLAYCIKNVQLECELYIGGKVDPRSQPESTGDEKVPSVENEATSLTGVGGKKDDTDITNYQDVDITNRIADSKKTEVKTKGKNAQTASNPAGK